VPVVGSEARVDEKNTEKSLSYSRIMSVLSWPYLPSSLQQQAAAAPAIVSFVPNAAANRLICRPKCLNTERKSETKMGAEAGAEEAGLVNE
jgi:hypothetical protein